MAEEMFNIGRIVNTHGVRGEVKVLQISDFAERFKVGNKVYLKDGDQKQLEFKIATHRMHKGFHLLKFEGYTNINEVEKYKTMYLTIKKEQLTALKKDEYYYYEIIGCDVYLTTGERIGVIKEVLSPGANDVWVISREKAKDLLIPYIEQIVKEVNIDEKRVVIDPMEGLLD